MSARPQFIIDSSVFVAALRGGEPNSDAGLQFLRLLENGQITALIPETVLIEVVAAIWRRTSDSDLVATVTETLLALPGLQIVGLPNRRRVLTIAATSGLRGMDCVVVATCAEQSARLLTFDSEMKRRAQPFVSIVDILEAVTLD